MRSIDEQSAPIDVGPDELFSHAHTDAVDLDAALAGDFAHQLAFVRENAWRLCAVQDFHPNSSSFGCFHTAYWRDKTSAFPDARFQEAGATLGLLSLPVFHSPAGNLGLPSHSELYARFSAALRALHRQQYKEGCYDEWYKGERGFAATAFTSAAFGLTAIALGPRLADDDRAVLVDTLARAGNWLAGRDDLVKTNHEAVACLSLLAIWRVTGDARFHAAALAKIELTLAQQTAEGWFPELRGADLGYSHLVLDYMMLSLLLTDDARIVPAMRRLLGFVCPHLHPDLTIGEDGSTCRNTYVGQIGLLLLARHDARAEAIVSRLREQPPDRGRLVPYLADDLRFARWSCLPVIAALLALRSDQAGDGKIRGARLPYPAGWTHHREAGFAAYHRGDTSLFLPVAGGAVLRAYGGARLAIEDLGYDVLDNGTPYTTRFYDLARPMSATTDETSGISVELEFGFARTRDFFPSSLSRALLRVGSSTAWSSRLTRAAIDVYRTKKNTALNQSATSVGAERGAYRLIRRVLAASDGIRIHDSLVFGSTSVGTMRSLRNHLWIEGEDRGRSIEVPARGRQISISKTLALTSAGPTVEITFEIVEPS